MEPWKYRAVAAWGHYLGSQRYYIEAEQAKASAENAPLDALYRRDGNLGWCTLRDLRSQGHPALADKLSRAVDAADLVKGLGTNDR